MILQSYSVHQGPAFNAESGDAEEYYAEDERDVSMRSASRQVFPATHPSGADDRRGSAPVWPWNCDPGGRQEPVTSERRRSSDWELHVLSE